jgi:hypothetical protein
MVLRREPAGQNRCPEFLERTGICDGESIRSRDGFKHAGSCEHLEHIGGCEHLERIGGCEHLERIGIF